MADKLYPRELIGYGDKPPQANWPDAKRLALQFVFNYEEGAESNVLHGDKESEAFCQKSSMLISSMMFVI